MEEISSIINGLAVSGEIRRDIRNIYQLIADAESRVHGKEVSEVHFHEVGMMDAIADITGCVMLFHELGAERIVTSPINVGFGQMRSRDSSGSGTGNGTALRGNSLLCGQDRGGALYAYRGGGSALFYE